jgi:hypothetical protein
MDNVILFPGWIRVDDGLWHGCKKYRHIGIVKESIPAKDWKRLYQWDLVRWLRGYREGSETTQRGGSAA